MKNKIVNLDELIHSIRELASSFAENSEEIRREVSSLSGLKMFHFL